MSSSEFLRSDKLDHDFLRSRDDVVHATKVELVHVDLLSQLWLVKKKKIIYLLLLFFLCVFIWGGDKPSGRCRLRRLWAGPVDTILQLLWSLLSHA